MWENPFGGLGVAVSMNQIMGSWRDFGKLAKNDEGLEACALICASFRPKGLWFCGVWGIGITFLLNACLCLALDVQR